MTSHDLVSTEPLERVYVALRAHRWLYFVTGVCLHFRLKDERWWVFYKASDGTTHYRHPADVYLNGQGDHTFQCGMCNEEFQVAELICFNVLDSIHAYCKKCAPIARQLIVGRGYRCFRT